VPVLLRLPPDQQTVIPSSVMLDRFERWYNIVGTGIVLVMLLGVLFAALASGGSSGGSNDQLPQSPNPAGPVFQP
jgi:hypothetical protein